MGTIAASGAGSSDADDEQTDFVPLTREQLAVVKASNPVLSPWWVVLGQLLVGVLMVGLGWVLFDRGVAKSVACGAMAVVIPAALFARGLTSEFATARVGTAVMSFFVWELVKIGMTLGLLLVAQRLVTDLIWPALLVGFVVTLKVYWLALAFKRKPRPV